MAWRMVERIVTDLAAHIDTNGAAKIAALNAEYNDATAATMTDFGAVITAEVDLQNESRWPVAVIFAESGNAHIFTDSILHATYTIRLGVVDMWFDSDVLRVRLYRYLRALTELLSSFHSHSTAPTGYHPMTEGDGNGTLRFDYSPTFSPRDGQFVSDASLVFTIEIEPETR